MKNSRHIFKAITAILFIVLCNCSVDKGQKPEPGLKDAFSRKFYIGVAMNAPQITGADTLSIKLIKHHFNSITAENCMKSESVQPVEDSFNYTLADKFVEFGKKNNMKIIGHVLIWHTQAPAWFFSDKEGKDVTRDVLIGRMKNHIYSLVGRYKGRVHGWDVVNEAIMDNGTWRENKFYKIIGEDYVHLAFEFAREADPAAELYYNDYSMALPGRREGVVKMIRKLQEQGIKVDGIGMQCHVNMNFPSIEEFEKSILAFSGLGVKVMITEMDITVLPSPDQQAGADIANNFEYKKAMNPYTESLPDSVEIAWNKRYAAFFKLFLKHRDKIDRVTVWGLTDGQSWRNYWPMRGRTDYPLLFNRDFKAKPIVETIIKEASALK